MSLEERTRMLGLDHQRADMGTIEPGADSGIFGRQWRGRIQGPESGGGYGWVNQTLRQQRYEELKRSERGVVRRYVEKMTGLSRAQTTRLITVYVRGEEVNRSPTGDAGSRGAIRGRTSHCWRRDEATRH